MAGAVAIGCDAQIVEPKSCSLPNQQESLREHLPVIDNGSFHSRARSQSEALTECPKTPVDIQFKDIKMTVSLGCRKGDKEILHGVNGRLPPNQLVAIMGPSGAGKSTLLDVLSGYKKTGVEGAVYVNGRGRDLNEFRKMSCYITQDDRLQPLLTVQENMVVAADLKLGTHVPKHEKANTIEATLTTLGLYEHLNTRAGSLSGGQKKRLSIALELISNPVVMFLDEPTTGLDSSSCRQVVELLRSLAHQGRTIVCTVHQPSAMLFSLFDQVYVLAEGRCLYQGTTDKLVEYLDTCGVQCPQYHNPADFVIELASGEYGVDKMDRMVEGTENGRSLDWLKNPEHLPDLKELREANPIRPKSDSDENLSGLQATPLTNQLKVLLRRGFLKTKRDSTMTHMRIVVNILVGLMLGVLFIQAGNKGSRVLDNYNLLFAILMHQMMSPMMLNILTFPQEMSILQKEHFNRWYSLKAYYAAINVVDLPVSIISCVLFSIIIYLMSGQPLEIIRFGMFLCISMLVVFVAQSVGLMVGAIFNVINGTFCGPTISVPVMMFAGFGVTLRDLPYWLHWGSYLSYLRYGLEGLVGAIYGMNRPTLTCESGKYCHYKYPQKFLTEISMRGDRFWIDVIVLTSMLLFLRILAYFLLRFKLNAVR